MNVRQMAEGQLHPDGITLRNFPLLELLDTPAEILEDAYGYEGAEQVEVAV